jgi:predicted DNA-binding transcriptional regulator AlpA
MQIRLRRARSDVTARRDELLTVRELLAELGGVSRRTFYGWRELGDAPRCIKLPNGELRVWRSDLLAWLRARTEHVA